MKFARIISLLSMAFLMLMASIGISSHLHFCGGKLVKVGVWQKPKRCCESKTGITKSCCKDQSTFYSLGNNIPPITPKIVFKKIEIAGDFLLPQILPGSIEENKLYQKTGKAPPLIYPDLVIRNCVFRI